MSGIFICMYQEKVAKQVKNYTKHCDAPPPSNMEYTPGNQLTTPIR